MPAQGDLFSFQQTSGNKPATPEPETPESAEPKVKSLMLIDASGFIFRAYHALPALTTSKGIPTHAVLGFTRMVLKLLRERNPTHLALCFDKDSRRGRLAIDPNYKANREAPAPDLVSQFSIIRQIVEVLNIPQLEVEGWEADDVIATMVKKARAQGFHSEIITSDKDFLQLLADDVRIYDPMKDRPIDAAYAKERFGISPNQMRDYQALVGDAIDNIPKVPGIGPKTAAELIEQFGDVETLISRVAEVKKPKIREALTTNVEQLRRALSLVSFRDDLQIDADPESLSRRPLHEAEARVLFTSLEFYRLMSEMPAPPPTPLRQEAEIVRDLPGLIRLATELDVATKVGILPTFEGEPHSAKLFGLGIMVSGAGAWFVDVPSCREHIAAILGPALTRSGLAIAAHDAKALMHVLSTIGVQLESVATDVELLSYLLNPSRKNHDLADLARERLRTELPAWPDKVAPSEIPLDRLSAICGAGADAIDRLSQELWTEVDGVGLGAVARDLELPLVPVIMRMEQTGVCIDQEALKATSVEVDKQVQSLLQEVYKHAGRELNVGSPIQLAQVLYEELKLPVLKRNKTGPSTDHEVLEKLAEMHPLPNAIIEYRNVAKLKSTYLDTLPTLIGADGRIRTTFHLAAAATGRLSSTNPNLQNIPIRTELGRQIRRGFVAAPGKVLVSADYSQVELRILAHISGDEALVAAFADSADVHARTAAEVFGVDIAQVTSEQRRAAKMVNYGIAYGLSAHGLSTRLNVPVEEAKGIIDRYFARFTGISRYVEETIERVRRVGYVESLFGRRRYMPDLVSRNRNIAMAAERAAINMPIQGTAADLVKRAMLELDRRLASEKLGARMLLQVHDELLFEAPEAEAQIVSAMAKEVMSGAAQLRVPLVVDVGIGRSWSDAH